MSDEAAIREKVLAILGKIAPEADLATVPADANLRRELDLDSIDFQNFLIRLSKECGLEIPDRDARQFTTLEGCVRYLARLPER